MKKILEEYFEYIRSVEIGVSIEELKVYKKNDVLYTIVDLKEKNISTEQFNRIIYQLYEGLKIENVKVDNNIIFICSDDKNYVSEIIAGMEENLSIKQTWGIMDTSRNIIMLEENADDRWVQLCHDISDFLNRNDSENIENQSITTVKDDIKNNIRYSAIHIVIINVIIFFIMYVVGENNREHLIDLYAINWKKVIESNEWYRLLFGMFMHADMDHLMGNMLSLGFMGTYLEKIIGRKKFLITYFVSGIVAGLTSLGYNMYLNNEISSLGASGAIYGLYGMLVFILITMRHILGKGSARRLLLYLVLCAYVSFSTLNIDHAAHFGGFVAGAVIGIITYAISKFVHRNE